METANDLTTDILKTELEFSLKTYEKKWLLYNFSKKQRGKHSADQLFLTILEKNKNDKKAIFQEVVELILSIKKEINLILIFPFFYDKAVQSRFDMYNIKYLNGKVDRLEKLLLRFFILFYF